MLDLGADVNSVLDGQGTTLLMWAVFFGNFRSVRAIATFSGVKLNAQVNDIHATWMVVALIDNYTKAIYSVQ